MTFDRRAPTPPDTKRRAVDLLKAGKVTLPELAKVMGVSTHMLWNWCRGEGVDWRKARERVVLSEWRKASK